MTIHILGKQGMLAVPTLKPVGSPLSAAVCYAKPSMDIFYSKYGFAFPLDYEGVPYSLVMDGKVPDRTDEILAHKRPLQYLLVTHDGLLWRIDIDTDVESVMSMVSYHVNTTTSGYWYINGPKLIIGDDSSMLLGFLYTDPTPKQIDAYWKKHFSNHSLAWLSIKDIVTTLHQKYPKIKHIDDIIDEKFKAAEASA